MAGSTAGLIAVLAMSTLCLGSELGERAACPYREKVRTFSEGADRFNMTVAVGGREEGCGAGHQCKALSIPVQYYENGSSMSDEVTVAWLCVAENRDRVRGDPGKSLVEGHVGGRGVDKQEFDKQACQEFKAFKRKWRSARKQLNKQERRSWRKQLKELRKECKKQNAARKQAQKQRRQQNRKKKGQQSRKTKKTPRQKSKNKRGRKSKQQRQNDAKRRQY